MGLVRLRARASSFEVRLAYFQYRRLLPDTVGGATTRARATPNHEPT